MIFIKRIPSIEQYPLETSEVVVDRQLRHIAILDANQDCVYLLTTIMLMHHIIEHKTNFEQSNDYAIQSTLKPHRTIKNSKGFGMLSIMFGVVKGRDTLAISYYNGLTEIYENRNNWSLCFSININPRLVRVQLFDSTLFTIQYSKNVVAYDISNGTQLNCSITNARQIVLKTQSGIIYQSDDGDLVEGKQIVIKTEENKVKDVVEDLEVNNFIASFCGRYIVRLRPSTIFLVDRKSNKVEKVRDLTELPTLVSISPFSYEDGDVAMLGYEHTLELERISPDKFKSNKVLLKITNLKHIVQKIIWIGPYQLLIFDEEEKMSFLQIFSSKLFI